MLIIGFALFVCFVCFSLSTPAIAAQATTTDEPDVSIEEYTDEYQQTIRVLRRETPDETTASISSSSNIAIDREQVAAQLMALGMSEQEIAFLTEEEWEIFATSPYIVSTETYFKVGDDGSKSVVSEAEANYAIAKEYEEVSPLAFSGQITQSYMRVYLYISQITSSDDGLFYFYSTAKWLTMPNYGTTDSLGIIAAEFMQTNEKSPSGYYCYNRQEYVDGELISNQTTSDTQTNFSSSDFSVVSYLNYQGTGVDFPLHTSSSYSDASFSWKIVYSDFFVKLACYGKVRYPDQRLNFDAVATYCHITHYPSITPSISIGVDSSALPTAGVCIALGFDEKYSNYCCRVECSYTP